MYANHNQKQTGSSLNRLNVTHRLGRLIAVFAVLVLVYPLGASAQTAKAPVGNGFRITPVRQPFVIEKGTSKTFTIGITISVPTYAEAGGYYGAIRFVPIIPTEEGRNVALTASIGTIVLVTVPGELRQQLDLVQFSAAQAKTARGFLVGGDVSVLTRLKNSGNIHVQPFGKVQVINMFGKTVHEYEFNQADTSGERSSVLPDSIRKFVDDLPKEKKLLGRYTIKMNLTYTDGGGEIISANSTFWYFPTAVFYGLLLLLLAIVVAVNYLVYRFRKKRKTTHRR